MSFIDDFMAFKTQYFKLRKNLKAQVLELKGKLASLERLAAAGIYYTNEEWEDTVRLKQLYAMHKAVNKVNNCRPFRAIPDSSRMDYTKGYEDAVAEMRHEVDKVRSNET